LKQIFGEVDPWFVAEFFGELPIDWEIIDGNAKQHKIQFNVNAKQPRLTTGWENLRSHYSWTENQKLYFYYYGGNQFFMVISNNPNDIIPSLFPPFHTLHNLVRNNPKFRMRLTSDNVTNDTMVSLIFFIFIYINISYFHFNFFKLISGFKTFTLV
jgi:hypothetical protein